MSPRSMKFFWALVCGFVVAGCQADKKPAEGDSTAAGSQSAAVISPPPINTGWNEIEAGPVLLLPVPDNAGAASVVNPMLNDSLLASVTQSVDSVKGLSVELFNRAGLAGTGSLSERVQSSTAEGCIAWPVMTVTGSGQKEWQVGFRKGVVTPLALDSLEAFSSADSMSVTTELARLASALPAASDSSFQGLPFAVRKAYRVTSSQSLLLIGDIVRKINEEANPREEHILLIAEKTGTPSPGYQTVFHSRATGSEEQVRTTEVLAAGRLVHGGQIILVVSFGYENGNRVVLIERSANSQWRITWRSAYTGC